MYPLFKKIYLCLTYFSSCPLILVSAPEPLYHPDDPTNATTPAPERGYLPTRASPVSVPAYPVSHPTTPDVYAPVSYYTPLHIRLILASPEISSEVFLRLFYVAS